MNKQITAEVFSRPDNRIRIYLNGRSQPFDPRSIAIRKDLADVAAADQFFAPHYASAVPYVCIARSAMVHGKPEGMDSAVTQILYGELFQVLDIRAGWAWGYCAHDHYVGYVRIDALHRDEGIAPTHRVITQGGLLFSQASIKSPVVTPLPGGALVHGAEEGDFLAVEGGYLHQRHVAPIANTATDWVAIARLSLGQPYLWGGRGDGGVDCSGLVQTALGQCGITVLRDTDQQVGTIGRLLGNDEALAKGDIVFFPGHVGIMSDAETLLHANAYWMKVVEEPLANVVERLISAHAEPITARRRIEA
ncbi:MAG TPA: NlpC/P60 family protein [Sphingobium sp.]|uniref:C40 family peptidase n=1 Tax=Sphingobium sp. TaxID=1912891 RepID=UPI002ED618F7